MTAPDTYQDIRDAVAKLCGKFPGTYWQELDEADGYPSEFVSALTESGYLSILIPEEYGGSGLPLSAACAVLEEIQRSGCNGGACHAQMYTESSASIKTSELHLRGNMLVFAVAFQAARKRRSVLADLS